jgi:hypothetical protein
MRQKIINETNLFESIEYVYESDYLPSILYKYIMKK